VSKVNLVCSKTHVKSDYTQSRGVTVNATRNWCVSNTVELVDIESDIYMQVEEKGCYTVVARGRKNRTFGLAGIKYCTDAQIYNNYNI
jgi:hypothetical protein